MHLITRSALVRFNCYLLVAYNVYSSGHKPHYKMVSTWKARLMTTEAIINVARTSNLYYEQMRRKAISQLEWTCTLVTRKKFEET